MNRKPLEYYLGLEYPFNVVADPDGGYVILFPDLPGCMTQVESVEEIGHAADEVRRLWIETEYEDGDEIPLPSYPEEFSGKFNVRIPRSLHRQLARAAEREGVSLNTYVVGLLARGDAQARVEGQLETVQEALATLGGVTGKSATSSVASPAPPVSSGRVRQARSRAS